MLISMYQVSALRFVNMLNNLSARLDKAQARAEARGFVAALGEHNEQVLRECLGWSRDSIGKLAKEGVLCGKRAEPEDEP